MKHKAFEKLVKETLNNFETLKVKEVGGYRIRVYPFNSIDKYRDTIKRFDLILDIREDFWNRRGVVKVYKMWADTFFIAYYTEDKRLAYPILVVIEELVENGKKEEIYIPKGYTTLDTDDCQVLITNGQKASFIVETLIKAGWEVKLHFI
jgi:hypothetical protein